jgi:arylsulfatase A-like enzyme
MKTLTLTALAAASAVTAASAAAPSPDKPNVILILADDLGWTDLGCFGSDLYETPHLDQLAREGMRFTQAYAACPVCSPTRAAVLTGMYPARLRVTDWIPGRTPHNPKLIIPKWTKHLPLESVTLAERFRDAGYLTASIGKWHLGQEPYYPEKQGFDINVAGTKAGSPVDGYFAPYKIPTLPEGPEGEYLTDRIGAEAVRFVEENRERRFFLYLPHFAVHTPIQAHEEITRKYEKKIKPGLRHTNAKYAAMIESMDTTIGALRDALEKHGLADNTVIIFASDNGGHLPTTDNSPLRVGKGSAYEGGVRVPLIIHWPGRTKPGSESDTPTVSTDFFPTLLEIAGLPAAAGQGSDGMSLVPELRGTGKISRDAIYWHYPHYQLYQKNGATPFGVIRSGDYRLVEFYDDMRVELYNLRDDIGETRDLAKSEPAIVAKLRDRLHAWRKSVGAQMPAPNPDYDPSKPEQFPGRKNRRPMEPYE